MTMPHDPGLPAADPDSLRYCSCADCGAELLATDPANLRLAKLVFSDSDMPPTDWERLGKRPYCRGCAAPRRIPGGRGGRGRDDPAGPSPWQENAIRDMEGG
jgi:hypothetical protein